MDWTDLYCDIDDFCQYFEPIWHSRQLATGEIMTIVIAFHTSNYHHFEAFYLMLLGRHRAEFPGLLSYGRFVELMPSVLGPLCAYLHHRFGPCTGFSFIDSTALAVCGNVGIECSKAPLVEARRRWTGSTASNSI